MSEVKLRVTANARLHRVAAALARATGASAGVKNRDRAAAVRFRIRAAFLLALGLPVLFAQTGGQAAQATDALPYSTGYLVTGDYAVGSVDFVSTKESDDENRRRDESSREKDEDRSQRTRTIPMRGVPANADILAAFLYWETIAPSSQTPSEIADSVQFRDQPIKSVRVKSMRQLLTGDTGQCFASGSGSPRLTATMFRADVLRLLPRQKDKNGTSTGKLLVNDTDLRSNNLAPHTVTLPERGKGKVVPDSAGASLVVVYRDAALPLRKIVLYDGMHIAAPLEVTTQTIRGFYQSDTSKKAKITHIVGSGTSNPTEVLWFNNSRVAKNPFPGSSKSSDRSWGHVTVDVSSLMKLATMDPVYGETVTSKVTYGKDTPYECPTWAATIFSTTILDADHDGIPDRLEQAGGPLKDPNDVELPKLYEMGARSNKKNILIEVNALRTTDAETYGSDAAPYDSGFGTDGVAGTPDDKPIVKSVVAPPHNHMPPSQVLMDVAEAFKNAPVKNLDGTSGIKALFDVGDPATYHALGLDYRAPVGAGDEYLVPKTLATGGELDLETACNLADPACHFPAYPGTIGWGFSLQKHMLGTDLDPDRPRFDKNRNGLFHYILYAHSRGVPKSLPCLDRDGSPTLYESNGQCAVGKNNSSFNKADYHVPTSSSGKATGPGDKAVVTLGRWENFVGTPLNQGATSLHELAHNLGLWHGGAPARLISDRDDGKGLVKFVEPNCKPNYLSVTSYLFQLHGLRDAHNIARIDLSRAEYAALHESSLKDLDMSRLADDDEGGSLRREARLERSTASHLADEDEGGSLPLQYRAAWFAPLGSGTLVDALGLPAATKLCNGLPLPAGVSMARFEALSLSNSIDWATNGFHPGEKATGQDINLDHIANPSLTGFDDWANIRLDQMGSGHVMGGAISNGGSDFGGSDFGGSDFGGSDFGGSDFGGSDFGGSDFGGLDLDGSDFGGSDFGGSDFGGQSFGGEAELTHEHAEDLVGGGGLPPEDLTACVIGINGCTDPAFPPLSRLHRIRLNWKVPNFGTPLHYVVYRITGAVSPEDVTATTTKVFVGRTDRGAGPDATFGTADDVPPPTTLVDTEELPNGQPFTYLAIAEFSDEPLTSPPDSKPRKVSGPSNFATVAAVNNPPVAIADERNPNEDTLLAGNVVVNDTDEDSPSPPTVRAELVSAPSHAAVGGFTLIADGSFSYQPTANFNGLDSFTYRLIELGTWSCPPAGTRRDCANNPAPVKMSADSNVATVSIKVIPVNDGPSATAQAVETTEDTTTPLAITLSGSDIETVDPANLAYVVTTDPSNGTLSGAGRNLTYKPKKDFNGGDSFSFTVTDRGDPDNCATTPPPPPQGCAAALTSDPAIVDVHVTEVNDPPVTVDDSKSTTKNKALAFPSLDLTANDSPGPGNENLQILTVTAVAATADTHGTVSLAANGTITYVPANGFTGLASFDYTVRDNGTTNGVLDQKSAVGHVVISVVNRAIVVSGSSNNAHILDLVNYTIESTQALGVTNALDVATTPDGKQAVVTSFDGKIVFLDLTTTPPTVVRTITTPIANEDVHVTITPAGYALVADGAPNSKVLSIDIATGQIVTALSVPFEAQGITAVPDQGIVLVNSFPLPPPGQPQPPGVVHVLALAADGTLSDTKLSVSTGGNGAINVTVSPDGRLALVANFDSGNIGILGIDASGTVSFDGTVASSLGFNGGQSIAFSPDGAHAYVNLVFTGKVAVLNIDSAHNVTDSGIRIATGGANIPYFGVDEIATDAMGTVLVHIPASTPGGNGFVAVIDPATNSVIATIPIPNDKGGGGIAAIP